MPCYTFSTIRVSNINRKSIAMPKCKVKYRPIIYSTDKQDQDDLLQSYLTGDGLCPACLRAGDEIPIEERDGETP